MLDAGDMVGHGGILGRPQSIAMTFSELTGRPHPDVHRGDVAVCVCAPGDAERLADSLAAVRAHTDSAHVLLVAGGEGRVAATVEDLDGALAAAAPSDVAVVAGGCLTTPGWLDGLRAAGDSDPRVALISALGPFSPPAGTKLDAFAAEVAVVSLRLRPDAPVPSSHCVLIRRAALELVGPLDPSLALPQALVDFTQRCIAHGLRHVLADDVVIGGTVGEEDAGGDEILARRYPYLRAWSDELAADRGSPLALAHGRASAIGRPLSVTIDGRCLSTSVTGTAVATLGLVEGLRHHAELRVRVLVLDDLGAAIRDRLTALGVELLPESEAEAADATDIAHRPYQLGAPEDLVLLRRLGRRMIVTQLDSIAYRTPTYFESEDAWRDYRELTRAGLASADEVVFLSPHAAGDALALGLVEEQRSAVIPLAVAQDLDGAQVAPGRAADASEDPRPSGRPLSGLPYLLCLGTDFAHKNRRFALRLLEALLAAQRFDGTLVFAGPHVSSGSSAGEEAAYLASRPELAKRVIQLGAVGEPQKRRLIEGAAAVVYPTTFEGFGLIPFEAAHVGVPALFAWVTSLSDLFPEELGLLVPWDAEASARAVAPVLDRGEARARQVQGVLRAGASLTLAAHARRHAELYDRALARPVSGIGRIGLRTAELKIEYRRAREDFRVVHRALDAIYQDPVSAAFVGPHAIVPEELQRLVLGFTTRPALRDAALALYRLAHRRGHMRG
jgi:hypothetical protein